MMRKVVWCAVVAVAAAAWACGKTEAPRERAEVEVEEAPAEEPLEAEVAEETAAAEGETVAETAGGAGLVDLNNASQAELEELPGVGPSLAEKIIAARPFSSVDDLDNVPGVGTAKMERLRPFVTVGGAAAASTAPGGGPSASARAPSGGGKVNINTATASQLDALPGIGPSTAENIIKYREANGRFASIDAIKNVPGIGDAKFNQIKDLITI